MPKQKRWEIKRDMDRALVFITRGQNYCVKWGYEYKDIHEDLCRDLGQIVGALELIKEAIAGFRDSI